MNYFLDKFALPIGLILIASLIIGAYFIINKTHEQDVNSPNAQLVIDVAGAINNPDIYTFNQGAIVEDAIKAAGGFTDQADIDLIYKTINRAALLQNYGKVYIPYIKNVANNNQPEQFNQNQSTLININTADDKLLDTLPGIGPITAQRIIKYRENEGQYQHKEDLIKVEGVSVSKYNKLKDLIIT